MFSYSQKERYMTDQEFYNSRKKYLSLFPISFITLFLFIIILLTNDNIIKIQLILMFSIVFLFIPLSSIPFLEIPFKLETDDDKALFLFIIYIIFLCLLMFGISIQELPNTHETILLAIIAGLYGSVIARYLSTILEIIEKQLGIRNKNELRK